MNRAISILLFLLLTGCSEPKKKDVKHDQNDLYSKNLKEYFQTLQNLQKFNGAVLVMRQGDVIIYENFNISNDKPKSLKTYNNSQFDIHSISKLMAKAVVVDLENDNLISKDDSVSKYLSDYASGDKITIQHLLDNQSGLPREFTVEVENLVQKNPDELIKLIKEEELLFEPGSESSYSNLGYQLLYYIISKITKQPFVEYLEVNYFKPLKMENTGAHFHLKNRNIKNLVANHEMDDDSILVVPNIQNNDKNQAKIFSNIDDLLIFLEYIKKPRYLNKLRNKNRNTVGWSGGGDGILSHMEYNIDGNYELVFFSNYDEIPFGDIVLTIEKIMTDQPYELPKILNRKEKLISIELLNSYEGQYTMREFNNSIFEFKVENNTLAFFQDGERNTELKAETDSTFFSIPTDEDYFEFRKSDSGDYEVIYYYKKVPIAGKKVIANN